MALSLKQFCAPCGFICADPECNIFLTLAAGRFDVICLSKQPDWRSWSAAPAPDLPWWTEEPY